MTQHITLAKIGLSFYRLLAISPVFLVIWGCDGTASSDAQIDGQVGGQNSDHTEIQTNENNTGQDDSVPVGTVRTVQINDVIFSSLPASAPTPAADSVALGRLLFWDPVLSGDQDVACASCHLPEFGYTDGRARSIGVGGVGAGPERVSGQLGEVPRNSQTILNTVWNGINEFGVFDTSTAPMFWDARTVSLANQAMEPIRSREEMRGENFTEEQIDVEVVNRLNSLSEYQALFNQAYGSDASMQNIGQALADFQSTLVANNAPFDRYLRGDTSALNNAQLNGMAEFAENGCAECHSGPMFSDFDTHVLGIAEAQGLNIPDEGNGNFAFRTPSLRQLAFTAPYFHGGQESGLEQVIQFYDNNNNSDNPNVAVRQLDQEFRNLPGLNNNEVAAIEAFLNALNDSNFDQSRPTSVPSGLPVGGAIE